MTSLAQDFAMRLDPSLRMHRLDRVPDPWQRKVLRSKAKRRAMLAARQLGKGEVLTCIGLDAATSKDEAQVGILTPGLRQSCRLLRRMRRALPLVAPHIQATNNAAQVLMLSNGSEIHAWPGNSPDAVRGDTLDMLLIDEGAWVHAGSFTAALPMLAMSGGSAVMASTPGGPSGYMFDVFAQDDEDCEWERHIVTADQCPRYSPETLASLRRQIGEAAYAVEMMCQWREASDAVFTSDELALILGTDLIVDQLPGESPLPDDDATDPFPFIHLPSLTGV